MNRPNAPDRRPSAATGPRAVALVGALLVLAAACTTPEQDLPPPCPKASIVEEASRLVRYKEGPGRDLIDIDFQGEIVSLKGECVTKYDEDTDLETVDMTVEMDFRLSRGAANRSRQAAFEYFVAIMDSDGEVMEKQTFAFATEFTANRTTVIDNDKPIELHIPVARDKYGEDYFVYTGFQLSREELEDNRRRSREVVR